MGILILANFQERYWLTEEQEKEVWQRCKAYHESLMDDADESAFLDWLGTKASNAQMICAQKAFMTLERASRQK